MIEYYVTHNKIPLKYKYEHLEYFLVFQKDVLLWILKEEEDYELEYI